MGIAEVMENLRDENYRMVYQDAKNRRICIICKQPAETFRNQRFRV